MQDSLSPMAVPWIARRLSTRVHHVLAWSGLAAQRRRYHRLSRERIAARFPEIQASLDGAEPGFTLLLGDSHAELLGAHPLGNRPVVNAGIGGISTAAYAARLPQLRLRAKPAAAVLIIGSNDLSARARPLSEETAARFEAAALALICWLRVHADKVLVVALPPIVQVPVQTREAAAVPDYSGRLERLAREHGCAFADPFAPLRDGPGGLARPDLLADGVHLADYGPVAARVAPWLA